MGYYVTPGRLVNSPPDITEEHLILDGAGPGMVPKSLWFSSLSL